MCQCDEISSCGSGNLSIRLENILVNLAKYLNCKKILQISKYIVAYCKRTLSNKYKLIVVLVDRLSVRWNRLLWSRQPFAPRHPGRDHPPVPPSPPSPHPPGSPQFPSGGGLLSSPGNRATITNYRSRAVQAFTMPKPITRQFSRRGKMMSGALSIRWQLARLPHHI